MKHFGRRLVISIVGLGVAIAPLSPAGPQAAAASPPAPAALGSSPASAAGSCWEIKQARSTATDGAYWLMPAGMPAPQEFFCDMTTSGGGWVLVGKGRNGWTADQPGQGDPQALLNTAFDGGSATHQLPAETIDHLLGGQDVSALTDGIRLRRATDSSGWGWQEARFRTRPLVDGWTWALGGGLPLASYSFDGIQTSTSQNTSNFGSDSLHRRVITTPVPDADYGRGFAFGSWVTGSSDFGSYLYGSTFSGKALPFTLVFLRPQVTASDGYTEIPDSGTPSVERQPLVKSNADKLPWGVAGAAGAANEEGNVEVQAFVESGGRMYVGGNFRYVQQDEAGTGRVEQPFLAAFDVASGAWISSFRPVLNEQVRALEVLPSGAIVAAGDFTAANGAPATAIVALNPLTGATDPSFVLSAENRLSAGVLRLQGLDVVGEHLYIAGAVTHFKGGGRGWWAYMRGMGRVSAADGTTYKGWNPEFNGSVRAIDGEASESRVYAAGYFTKSGAADALKAAAVQTADGAPLVTPTWSPVWSNSGANYQHAIDAGGQRVWVGGAEHSLFSWSTTTFEPSSTTIMNYHGDVQSIEIDGGVTYGGCHCNEYTYEGAGNWPSPSGWHSLYSMNWAGAWATDTGERLPEFSPSFQLRLGSGIWAMVIDSRGALWTGGDISAVRTKSAAAAWSGGFARFSAGDHAAPATPSAFAVAGYDDGTVTLKWNAVSDPSGVTYQILRGDRTVAVTGQSTITMPAPAAGATERYFVRAADGAGNLSASTPVLEVGDPPENVPPTAVFTAQVEHLAVALDASSSSDTDGVVVDHAWDFGDGTTGTGETTTHTYATGGDYPITLTVTDDDGATHTASQTITVTEPPDVLVHVDATWQWRFELGAPGDGWNQINFDASNWGTGGARLGWGSSTVETEIDTLVDPNDRPRAAYFRHEFQIADPSELTSLEITTIADDGAVYYVNGVEVARENMPAGDITHLTFASSARNWRDAEQNPVRLSVPASLLVAGTNVVAAESHVNYRKSPNLTFELEALATGQ